MSRKNPLMRPGPRAGTREPPAALSTEAVAVYIGLSVSWLEQARLHPERDGPPFIRIGKRVVYMRSDLDAWLDRRRVVPLPREPRHDTGT